MCTSVKLNDVIILAQHQLVVVLVLVCFCPEATSTFEMLYKRICSFLGPECDPCFDGFDHVDGLNRLRLVTVSRVLAVFLGAQVFKVSFKGCPPGMFEGPRLLHVTSHLQMEYPSHMGYMDSKPLKSTYYLIAHIQVSNS